MPLAPPVIDDRRYAQLVEETLARARVHTPEWTNFGQGDPGVTLVQLFSFLTESLLYRANLIPERNRVRFLELLRVPLAPAAAAAGLVSIRNERGAAVTQTLAADLEVRAGPIPFRTQLGLDVLPVEAHAFFKRRMTPSAELLAYYQLLYASYQAEIPQAVDLYQAVALEPRTVESVDLSLDTVDGALWIALVARKGDDPAAVRKELAARTLTLGIVPALEEATARLVPGGTPQPRSLLRFELPMVPAGGSVERSPTGTPTPRYRQLEPRTDTDLLSAPGVVQLTLPDEAGLRLWEGVDPLEGGVGDMPPTLEDTALAERTVTWLRIRADGAARARIRWAGINTVPVRQIERVVAEPLADGEGTPDQARRLSRAPVLPGTVSLVTRLGADAPEAWAETDDLAAAPPEVPVADWTAPPGATAAEDDDALVNVFELDPEAGVLRFGDGLRGRRLPRGARVYASYEYSAGAAGNVPEGAIDGAPQLPSGFSVINPVRSWGGADAETVDTGEKQIRRYLNHRDRLVSPADFHSIVCRTPGVQIGRVEVLPAYHPDLGASEPGSAPGVVTLMAIPLLDPGQPDAPRSDRLFLNALCRYLDPRRLVTTELVVRGADYKGIWISVGVEVAGGVSVAEVVESVKVRLRALLAPIGPDGCEPPASVASVSTTGSTLPSRGWPLRTAVASRVLLAEAARVPGVLSVAGVLLAEGSRAASDVVEMSGLELPRVLGISVVAGEPIPIDALRGTGTPGTGGSGDTGSRLLPVPVVPETC